MVWFHKGTRKNVNKRWELDTGSCDDQTKDDEINTEKMLKYLDFKTYHKTETEENVSYCYDPKQRQQTVQ